MKRVLTAAILIPIVVLALFKAPLWLFTLLVFGVAVLTAHEYFGIMKAHWDTEDYHQMMLAPLRFTDEDLQLIRNGLRSRIDHTREAPAPQIEARLTIKLRAYNQAHVSNRSLKQAESEVTSIFETDRHQGGVGD